MVPNRVRLVLFFSAILALVPSLTTLRAQYVQIAPAKETFGEPRRDWTDDVPAHLAFVDGQVMLEREGKLEPAVANAALLAGDRLTTRGGRAEILYADGSTLAVDEETEIDLLDDSLVRLVDGRLRMTIPKTTADLDYRIDASAAYVEIKAAGEYRVDTGVDQRGEPDVDLMVFRGSAELVNDFGRTLVRAGKHAVASATEEPSAPFPVNTAAGDEFDRWAEERRTSRVASESAAYLPETERYYSSALDYNGTWEYEAQYGPVWYPRVADDWRPYSQGSWSYTSYYGWLWVGIDSWSWPTHHYGRWGVSSNRWYWIPGRQWGPAWVAWGSAPGFVSWCPLGFDGHAAVGFQPIGVPYAAVPQVDPFTAWTIMPATGFAHNVWVTEHAVSRNRLPPQIRGEFRERPLAPTPVANTVSKREIPPIHAPTRPRNVTASRERPAIGPFDAARAAGRSGASATPRGPISSTIIGTPMPASSASGGGNGSRSTPGSRSIMPDRPVETPSRGAPPAGGSSGAPRVQPPPDAPSRAVDPARADIYRSAPPRAIPRPSERTISPPAAGVDTTRTAPPPTGADRSAAPAPPPPSGDRGRAVDRTTPAQPSAPPASAAPPPSRGGGRSADQPAAGKAVPPAAAPPSAQPATPPAGGRGGGGDTTSGGATSGGASTTQGKPTGRGGGGGGR